MHLNSKKTIVTICIVIAVISACFGEAAYLFLTENTVLRTICKAVTAAGILGLVLMNYSRERTEDRLRIAALFFAGIADVIIVHSFPAGVVLFALAHICLIIMFLKERSLNRMNWIIWGITAAAIAALIIILGSKMGIYAYGAAVYAPVILLMVFAALKQAGISRIAAFVFVASDLLLALYHWQHLPVIFHIIYMAMFYIALFMFAGKNKLQ